MRVTYLLAAAAVVAAVPLGLLGLECAAAQRVAAERAAGGYTCYAADPLARVEGGARVGVVVVGVLAMLGVRRLLRRGAH